MSVADLQAIEARYVLPTYARFPVQLVRGAGCRLWDDEGNEYLDFLAGISVCNTGHCHPEVVGAVQEQAAQLMHTTNLFYTAPGMELAQRLSRSSLGGRVFFGNSGAEANEAALKATRKTGRTHLVAAEESFHGRTMGALALTAKAAYREPFEPLPGDVTFVPYGDADALAAAVTDETAAVVLEPLQGEAGVNVAPTGYLAAARRITRDHGSLLWLDEVQTGIGRTGRWFAAATEDGVEPDLVTLAKGLAGGIPVGACLAFGDAGTLLQPGNHGTTFGGNPVSAAAALAVLDTIESEGLLDHVTKLGEHLRTGLAHAHVTEVRGEGLLVGISLDAENAAGVVQAAQDAGFILNMCTPDRVRLAPPLVLAEQDADQFLAAWPAILATAYEEAGP
jgi:acetylornithine aminotransferase